jgi:hypothetical protein
MEYSYGVVDSIAMTDEEKEEIERAVRVFMGSLEKKETRTVILTTQGNGKFHPVIVSRYPLSS